MKKNARIIALLMAAAMSAGAFAGCGGTQENTGGTSSAANSSAGSAGSDASASAAPDTSKEVSLSYYMYGSEGVANPDILAKINEKLKADINATLEIRYIDWGDVSTKYPLMFASGEKFDMAYASPGAAVSYYTLAAQDALTDITDMLGAAAPALKAEIPDSVWAGARYNGKIYAVPTMYSEFTPYGFVYRRDLREKYGAEEVTSLETMEAYLDKVLEAGEFTPLNLGSADHNNLYRMFVGLNGSWINAPGIPQTQNYLVASSAENYKDIIHPAFTDEFETFVGRMRAWADKGYWTKDVMAAQQGGKDRTTTGLSGGYITHMPDWTGNLGAMKEKLPGVETDFWCFEESQNKIVRKMGVENSTVISANSANPERSLMAIEKFMTDESYYRLIQYGIEGREYEIVDGVVQKPASYNADKDAGGFAAWSLRNDRFNLPLDTEDPRRYELNEKWDKVAIDNPYVGFSFDDSNVSTELASIANVDATLGIQLLFGKTQSDAAQALAQYREQLKNAGIDKVIEEVKTQLESFTPVGA